MNVNHSGEVEHTRQSPCIEHVFQSMIEPDAYREHTGNNPEDLGPCGVVALTPLQRAEREMNDEEIDAYFDEENPQVKIGRFRLTPAGDIFQPTCAAHANYYRDHNQRMEVNRCDLGRPTREESPNDVFRRQKQRKAKETAKAQEKYKNFIKNWQYTVENRDRQNPEEMQEQEVAKAQNVTRVRSNAQAPGVDTTSNQEVIDVQRGDDFLNDFDED